MSSTAPISNSDPSGTTVTNRAVLLGSTIQLGPVLAGLADRDNAAQSGSYILSTSPTSVDGVQSNVTYLVDIMTGLANEDIGAIIASETSDTQYDTGITYVAGVTRKNRLIERIRKYVAYLLHIKAEVLIMTAEIRHSGQVLPIPSNIDTSDVALYIREVKRFNKQRFSQQRDVQDLYVINDKLTIAYQSQLNGVYYIPDMGANLDRPPAQFTIPSTYTSDSQSIQIDETKRQQLNTKLVEQLVSMLDSVSQQGAYVNKESTFNRTQYNDAFRSIEQNTSATRLQRLIRTIDQSIGELTARGLTASTTVDDTTSPDQRRLNLLTQKRTELNALLAQKKANGPTIVVQTNETSPVQAADLTSADDSMDS